MMKGKVKLSVILFAIGFILSSCSLGINTNDQKIESSTGINRSIVPMQFLSANGTRIEKEDGSEFFMTGINLGNWLLWEGYLMMGDFNYRTHTQFLNSLQDAFGGDMAKALEFEHQWRLNYVTEQAIIDLKALGYNTVRVPFHYNMFWDQNTYSVTDHGFQYIDNLIQYCQSQDIYILLDMHAAPGYQNPGDHSDNMDSNESQPRDTVTFWDGDNVNIASQVWRHIANYYKDEPAIWGYDLINEPVPQAGREYELLGSMITMRNAIREVDNNHIIVAEGSWWGSDMGKLDWMDRRTQRETGINSRWDDNLVYQTHHYSNDPNPLDDRLSITNKLNIPLILGEYGETENQYIRSLTDWCLNNNVGYYPWSFKKMSHDRTLWTIHPNSHYEELKTYINNGGPTPRADLYDDLISFCQNNISNGAPGLEWHQGFYDAVENTNLSVDFEAPTTPLNLSTTSTTSSVTLNWDPSTDNVAIDHYKVRIDGGTLTTVNGTSYVFTELNPLTSYLLEVCAVDTSGNTSAFTQTSATTLDAITGPVEIYIEAENYNSMSGVTVEACNEGGQKVSSIDSGDWFDFVIDVPESGTYTIEYRVSDKRGNGHFRFDTDGGSTILDDVSVPRTGRNTWTTVTSTVTLTQGQMTVGVYAYAGGFEMNWIKLSK